MTENEEGNLNSKEARADAAAQCFELGCMLNDGEGDRCDVYERITEIAETLGLRHYLKNMTDCLYECHNDQNRQKLH